jgi:hypothetical protein
MLKPLILSVFLAGCAATPARPASSAFVPLREGQVAPKWEHKCADIERGLYSDGPEVGSYLSKMGAAGWELVSHTSQLIGGVTGNKRAAYFCFKRPM